MNLNIVTNTCSMPLMLNFVKPTAVKTVKAEDIAIVYDPTTQTTMYLGGGNSNRSKSQVASKRTETGWIGGKATHWKEDFEYGFDD